MNEKRRRLIYILGDYFSTLLGVVVFSVLRFYIALGVEWQYNSLWGFLMSHGVVLTMLLFPPVMVIVYALSGLYVTVAGRSRIVDILKSFMDILVGSLIFFFAVLLNDLHPGRIENYKLLLVLVATLFVCVMPVRVFITSWLLGKRQELGQSYAYLIIDSPDCLDDRAQLARVARVCSEHGMKLVDTVDVGDVKKHCRSNKTLHHVSYILSPSVSDDAVINALRDLYGECLPVFVIPDGKSLLLDRVRYDNVSIEPIIDVTRSQLSDSVVALKRGGDIVVSFIGLLVTLPVMAALSIAVRHEDGGPVIYSQERVGYLGRKFRLYKMRSMRHDAEQDGTPRLSSSHDPRVTRIGRFMRQYRLDELPNLWNVLKGDMSLVGPRPEREYYLRQIAKRAPQSVMLRQVRPGVTSWGMVKYGYAETVDGMVERLRYDMLYLQNMSLSVDLRILYQTIFTVARGEGK